VKVSSVVWSVDWDGNTAVLADGLRVLEEALGSGWRTSDGDSHGADGADPGLVVCRNTRLLVEGIKRILNILLGDTSNDSGPWLLLIANLLEVALDLINAATSAEGNANSLDGKWDKVGDGLGGNDGGSGKSTGAESEGAGVGCSWKLGWVLGEVSANVSFLKPAVSEDFSTHPM